MNRFDLLSPRKGRDDKTYWHKVGAAFPRDKGGFQLVFDSLPLADNEGRVTLMMWEAKERDDRGQQGGGQQSGGSRGGQSGGGDQKRGQSRQDLDDDIPF